MYLITVYFDEKTNRILRRYMDRIGEVTGNTFMIDHKVPPHMTVAAVEARKADVLRPAFERLAGREDIRPGELQVVTTGQFLPYVFFVGPVMNEYLMHLSQAVFDEFREIPEVSVSKVYRPGSWMPHITLAKTLEKEQMQEAFALMQESFAPFVANVVEIGLSKVNPHQDVERVKL